MSNVNDLEKYHRALNRKEVLPGSYLRRNHKFYPFVCYVNNIISLYMSENYEEIPVMINRAYQSALEYSDEEKKQDYIKMVLEYISAMAKYVSSLELTSEQKGLLPPSILR